MGVVPQVFLHGGGAACKQGAVVEPASKQQRSARRVSCSATAQWAAPALTPLSRLTGRLLKLWKESGLGSRATRRRRGAPVLAAATAACRAAPALALRCTPSMLAALRGRELEGLFNAHSSRLPWGARQLQVRRQEFTRAAWARHAYLPRWEE